MRTARGLVIILKWALLETCTLSCPLGLQVAQISYQEYGLWGLQTENPHVYLQNRPCNPERTDSNDCSCSCGPGQPALRNIVVPEAMCHYALLFNGFIQCKVVKFKFHFQKSYLSCTAKLYSFISMTVVFFSKGVVLLSQVTLQ